MKSNYSHRVDVMAFIITMVLTCIVVVTLHAAVALIFVVVVPQPFALLTGFVIGAVATWVFEPRIDKWLRKYD